MFPEFNANTYFFDLLALSIILVPLMALITHETSKRLILTLSGIYLLYFIAPRLALFYLIFWSFVFILQRIVSWTAEKKGNVVIFWLCTLSTLAPMIIWKIHDESFSIAFNLWGNQGINLLSENLWKIDLAKQIIIPIGLSFAVFRAIDLLVKTYIGKFEAMRLDHLFFYGFFPPVQIVGPIIEYEEIQKPKKTSANDIYQGILRIAFGLIKVLIIAAILQKSGTVFYNYETMGLIKIWALLILYTWFFYINFSGYSDLAIGLSRLYGFTLKENFCFPYFRKNPAEFWNNWHMGLSRFAQRNAFVPLGGYRKKTQYIAIFATICVIALWHDISLGMLVFALYHGSGLIIHRYISDKSEKKQADDSIWLSWGKILSTYLFITLSFPLLALPLEKAGPFYLSLVGL